MPCSPQLPALLRIPEKILNFVAVTQDPFRMGVCVRVLKKVYLEPGLSEPTPTWYECHAQITQASVRK